MNTLKALQNRVSVPRLTAPAPSREDLNECFKAAFRAADHGKLQPRRFLIIEGEGLTRLGEVFVEAGLLKDSGTSPSLLEKFRAMPLRAPMIIVAIAVLDTESKVPESERLIACGAAVQNLLNAFFMLGYGAVWRSGDFAQDRFVAEKLGLNSTEHMIGFIYCGTPNQEIPLPPVINLQDFVKDWSEAH